MVLIKLKKIINKGVLKVSYVCLMVPMFPLSFNVFESIKWVNGCRWVIWRYCFQLRCHFKKIVRNKQNLKHTVNINHLQKIGQNYKINLEKYIDVYGSGGSLHPAAADVTRVGNSLFCSCHSIAPLLKRVTRARAKWRERSFHFFEHKSDSLFLSKNMQFTWKTKEVLCSFKGQREQIALIDILMFTSLWIIADMCIFNAHVKFLNWEVLNTSQLY